MTDNCVVEDVYKQAYIFKKDINDREYNDAIKVGTLETFVNKGRKNMGKHAIVWIFVSYTRIYQKLCGMLVMNTCPNSMPLIICQISHGQ